MDILAYNRAAWDKAVLDGNKWTVAFSDEQITKARAGKVEIVLTPTQVVPAAWLGELVGKRVLCLAGAGGQQAPLLAAAGADVIVYDNSPNQLQTDREVAVRAGLSIDTVLGDMADLSCFEAESFDLIVHPVSNCFVPDVTPVWRECVRVLKPGGELLSGLTNPVVFLVDPDAEAKGELNLKYKVPYSDTESLSDEERRRYTDKQEPLVFGHSLEDLIGGQLRAGLVLLDMFEDWSDPGEPLGKHMPGYFATRARKPTATQA